MRKNRYLWSSLFRSGSNISLDNSSLLKLIKEVFKWLLQQNVSTPFQHFWLSKLMGFSYEIQYKSGTENKFTDALSRVYNSKLLLMAISVLHSDMEQKLIASYALDGSPVPIFSLHKDYWREKENLLWDLMRISKSLSSNGYTVHLKKDIQGEMPPDRGLDISFIGVVWPSLSPRNTCQASKHETQSLAGLLQPLSLPEEVRVDISMDFIIGLPRSFGKGVIFVVFDRLSKYAHFMALKHPYST